MTFQNLARAAAGVGITLAAVAFSAIPAAAQNAHPYVRATIGYDWSLATTFLDRDCEAPDNYFGCGIGEGGLSTEARGDFGGSPFFEIGVGVHSLPSLRFETTIAYRSGLAFEGNGNFIHAGPDQPVTADFSQLTLMSFVYFDWLKPLGLESRLQPFVGAGLGAARNAIGPMLYEFPFLNQPRYSLVQGGVNWDLAWSLVAGFGFELSDRATIELAYRYNHLGEVVTDAGPLFIQRPSSTLTVDIGETWAPLNTHAATLSLRWAL